MAKKRILILATSPQRRLTEEFKKLDCEVEVCAPSDFYAYISDVRKRDRIYLKHDADQPGTRIRIKDFSAVVPRISGSGFRYGLNIVEHLNRNLGIWSSASSNGLRICADKWGTSQFLSQFGLRQPKQILAHNLSDFKETIELVGDFPVVVKLQRGSQGAGVFILRDKLDASQTLRALQYSSMDLILQQKLDSGTPANDLRIWVIGSTLKEPKIIAYKRFALSDDFRSNYSLSGSGEKVEITEEEKTMAITAARALKMEVAGVDIMRNVPEENRPYLVEVNGNPGLSGVEAVTGDNVAGEFAKHVVNNCNRQQNRAIDEALEKISLLEKEINGKRDLPHYSDFRVSSVIRNASLELLKLLD